MDCVEFYHAGALSDYHKAVYGHRPDFRCTDDEWNDVTWLKSKWQEIDSEKDRLCQTPEGRDQLRFHGSIRPQEPALPLQRVLTIHRFAYPQVSTLLRSRNTVEIHCEPLGRTGYCTLRFESSAELFEEVLNYERELFQAEMNQRIGLGSRSR